MMIFKSALSAGFITSVLAQSCIVTTSTTTVTPTITVTYQSSLSATELSSSLEFTVSLSSESTSLSGFPTSDISSPPEPLASQCVEEDEDCECDDDPKPTLLPPPTSEPSSTPTENVTSSPTEESSSSATHLEPTETCIEDDEDCECDSDNVEPTMTPNVLQSDSSVDHSTEPTMAPQPLPLECLEDDEDCVCDDDEPTLTPQPTSAPSPTAEPETCVEDDEDCECEADDILTTTNPEPSAETTSTKAVPTAAPTSKLGSGTGGQGLAKCNEPAGIFLWIFSLFGKQQQCKQKRDDHENAAAIQVTSIGVIGVAVLALVV